MNRRDHRGGPGVRATCLSIFLPYCCNSDHLPKYGDTGRRVILIKECIHARLARTISGRDQNYVPQPFLAHNYFKGHVLPNYSTTGCKLIPCREEYPQNRTVHRQDAGVRTIILNIPVRNYFRACASKQLVRTTSLQRVCPRHTPAHRTCT
jgi:hypothetical protein